MAADVRSTLKQAMDRSPLVDHAIRSTWGIGHKAVRPRRLQRYLRDTDQVRIMIGAGPTAHPGWIATDLTPTRRDVIFLDAGEPFPFDTGSVDRIHTEHMIEHVDFQVGQTMLAECARILKPGGRIRVATPDYDTMVRLATRPLDDDVAAMVRASNQRHDIPEAQLADAIHVVNRMFSGHGHRFLYSEELLTTCLAAAGFATIVKHRSGETVDPEFAGLDAHGGQVGSDWNRYHTLVLEAEKQHSG